MQDLLKPRRSPDVPEVLLFPPLIPLLTLVAGALLGRWLPWRQLARLGLGRRLGIGGPAVLAGMAIAGSGARTLANLGTNINPSQPTLALATEGVFARTRNPLYVGGGLAFMGLTVGLALDGVLLLLVPSFVLLHYGVVLPEERYLERKFGDRYRRYKSTVPRYGWRI
ncbi:MAG: isoprenylcysteine carboxylmethyltransferase family protein [Verrucomicrobia bacterium]|nr:isoprenylcysteine carboxylmethyltransferase family protein [Verrucomicrobiota bacterium]